MERSHGSRDADILELVWVRLGRELAGGEYAPIEPGLARFRGKLSWGRERRGETVKIDAKRRTLTTGDIAKLCGVNFRTVIRWIQRGHLKAFQLPGRGDNRVLVKDFLQFLHENNMPVPDELRPFSSSVLIVDGDSKLAKSMKRALDKAGFQTEIAADGFAAGHMVSTMLPAVIIIDPTTDGVGGLAAVKRLRNDPHLSQLKMIVLSDMAEKDLRSATKAGADEAIIKPLKNPQLVKIVAELAGVDLE